MLKHFCSIFKSQGERGQAFVMVTLLLAVFGGIAGVAIDLGSYSADRRDLQNAADAIALAASQELPDTAAAQTAADQWAANNNINLSEMTVTFIAQNPPAEPNPKVRVELSRSHNFTFARMVGITSADVGASAAAIRTSPGGSAGLTPWSVEEEVKNSADPGDSVVLKYDANNGAGGNFGAIRLDGSGSSTYESTIESGSSTMYCAADAPDCSEPWQVTTEPGNMTGPTEDGTDYRLNNTEAACDEWSEVVVTAADGTHGLTPACNPFGSGGNPDSLRVIIIPVIDELCEGSCTVNIVEFALFFLEGYGSGGCTGNDCEITGRFIGSNTNYGAVMGTFNEDTFVHFVRLVE